MKPQIQNRRPRGRNNGNRKGNPLMRNYESNGPDTKIRGSAQQIAEKYASLARDAQSVGDRVMSENYLQHAEHYNRILAGAYALAATQENRLEQNLEDDEPALVFDSSAEEIEASLKEKEDCSEYTQSLDQKKEISTSPEALHIKEDHVAQKTPQVNYTRKRESQKAVAAVVSTDLPSSSGKEDNVILETV